jgi:cytochrome c oxidase subunit 3
MSPDDKNGGPSAHHAHHFKTPEQQQSSAKLGMWVFLAQEILFFGGLFMAYIAFRYFYPETFLKAHEYLSIPMGSINTVVLLTSSLTMALAVRSAQTDNRKALVGFLAATLLLAGVFLLIKFFEYNHKAAECLLPGKYFGLPDLDPRGLPVKLPDGTPRFAAHCAVAQKLYDGTQAAGIFFGLYFVMTGVHGLHVVAGMGVILWILIRAVQGRYHSKYHTPVENVGLYWHLVDVIWIFIFPLLYLIR